MQGEFETNKRNSKQYNGFYTCENCKDVCEGKYKGAKEGTITLEEKWWNPIVNEFEQ